MLINTLKIYNIFAGENDVIFQKLTMFFALFFGGFFNLQNFYLALLNANQRYCYQILESAVRAKMPSYNAPNGLSAADINAVNKAFTFEHPEICYFPGIETSISGNSVRLRYLNSDQGAFERKVDEVFNQIRRNLKGKTDEYSIVKEIYEYITLNYTYDHKLFDEYRSIWNDGEQGFTPPTKSDKL